jgi:O-succinylbenzoic acid--CoA ligase
MTWSLPALIARHAEDAPDALALVDGPTRWTWVDLSARADAWVSRLGVGGIAPGARVAMVMRPSADLVAAIVAVLRVGGVAAPVPTGFTARETDAALDALAPSAVLHDGDVRDGAPWTSAATPEAEPASPAVVVLTSGTTARPKGVVLSCRAMAASADAWLAVLPPVTGWAMPLGLAHVAGLGILWRAVRGRVPVTLLPAADPAALLDALRAPGGPSHVSLVPGQLVRLLDVAGDAAPPAGVRAVLLGGGSIPASLVGRALRAGWPVVPTYGLSEMGSGVTALPAEEAAHAPGTAGRPLPGVTLTVDEPGRDGVGEIVVSGPSRFSGYLGEAAAASGEPFRTGDMGRLDEAGRLVVVDRRTDRIVRGGENVDPGEVEAVLETHPAVAAAAVVGVPDATWGHVPAAAIVLASGTPDPGDAALAAHARASLAGFKVPVSLTRLDALPRTSGGKLRREAVRALLAGEPAGELARPDGDAIGWRVTGDGSRAVILLHGTLSTAQQLDRLATALANRGDGTVHALDRRGAGSSRLAVPRALDVAVHVDDVRAYLDARGIDRAAIVGISMGGVIALEAAARLPDRVEAVVAYEPPYGLVADDQRVAWFRRVAEDTRGAHDEGGSTAAAETFLRHVAGDEAWDHLPDRARAFLGREGDGALADSGITGLEPDGLAGIAAPVLLVTGSASEPFYAPIAAELARRIPGARVLALEGLRHTSPITDPTAVADAIRPFLDAARRTSPAVHLEPAR